MIEHPHKLSVLARSQSDLERVGEGFVLEKLRSAQEKSWEVLYALRDELKVGMTEVDGQRLCLDFFKARGVTKHWHRPWVRFGPGTMKTFHDPDQNEHRLTKNDAVYFDLGPVWPDDETGLEYEGDVGDGFAFGVNQEFEKLKIFTHRLFQECQNFWKKEQPSGERLYEFAENYCSDFPYTFNQQVEGHRLSDFPHFRYSREKLTKIDFVPQKGLWIFEVHVLDQSNQMGCFVEDILGEDFVSIRS